MEEIQPHFVGEEEVGTLYQCQVCAYLEVY